MTNSFTTIYSDSSQDGDIMYVFSSNQSECDLDLIGVYNNYTANITTNKTKLFVSFKLICDDNRTIHFTIAPEAPKKRRQPVLSVELLLNGCSISVQDLNLFRHIGNIFSITQSNLSMIHADPNCSALSDVLSISCSLPCSQRDASDISTDNKYFWEICENPFEHVHMLSLEGCYHSYYEVNNDVLQNAFPVLQALQLKYVDLRESLITFPWTDIYINRPQKTLQSYRSSNFESKTISLALGRRFTIEESAVNVTQIKLHGYMYGIKLTQTYFGSLNADTLGSVKGLVELDLSSNDLDVIDENAFKQQTELEYLSLKMNHLTDLESSLFKSLYSLLSLDLSFNKLTSVNQNLFKNLRHLQELNLEHNDIKTLQNEFLKEQVSSLVKINLSWNPLYTIPEYLFYAPKLQFLLMRHCSINTTGFQIAISRLNYPELSAADIDHGMSLPDRDYIERMELDLSYGNIRNISIIFEKTELLYNFIAVTRSFHIVLTGNPVDCTCITELQDLALSYKEYDIELDWICAYPSELNGRTITSLTPYEIYCPVKIDDCPKLCSCFERSNKDSLNQSDSMNPWASVRTIIVDCRNIIMTNMPKTMPLGNLELWFQNASLTQIPARQYFRNTSVLDISHNRINFLTSATAIALSNLSSLKLDHNNLTSLPIQIMSIKLLTLTLASNPFICDCNTKWLKLWLLNRTSPVTDWNHIECVYSINKVNQLVTVHDSFFVCPPGLSGSISEHVTLPAIVLSCILFVLVSLSLLIYFQSFTVKVLLFLYCGIHSFDRPKQSNEDMDYDVFVLYSRNDSAFVKTNVLDMLVSKGYRICDMYVGLVVGLSFLKNFEHMMNKSRKILFSWTTDMLTDKLLMSAWNMAYDRAVNKFTDSVIIILDSDVRSKCYDPNLRKYVKSRKFIKKHSKLIQSSVCYLMPNLDKSRINDINDVYSMDEACIPMTEDRNNIPSGLSSRLVYITYPDELDQEFRQHVIPELKQYNYEIKVFEDDFLPGTDIRNEIYEKLDGCNHFIFILSNDIIKDEVKMFILSTVMSKSLLSFHNFLLLFTTDTLLPQDKLNHTELENYFEKYVTGSVRDPNFIKALMRAFNFGDCYPNTDQQ